MIDPGDARAERARQVLVSVILLTISAIVVVIVGSCIYEQESERRGLTIPSTPLPAPLAAGATVRVLAPDGGQAFVFQRRSDYEAASGVGDRLGEPNAALAPTRAPGVRVPSGTTARVLEVIPGGPALVEVTKGARKGTKGFISPRFLSE
jgi:hypothetical protein